MSTEESGAPQMERIRSITAGDQVTIPGPAQRAFERKNDGASPFAGPITAVEIIRDHGTGQILAADRVCRIGDVIAVQDVPRDEHDKPLMITGDRMGGLFLKEHAERLINRGYAVPTTKPATVGTGASLRPPGEVERAIIPAAGRPEKATARPQRTGVI